MGKRYLCDTTLCWNRGRNTGVLPFGGQGRNLDDENNPHPNRLEVSPIQFNIILGIYTSALKRAPVALPVEPEVGLLDALQDGLRE